MSRWNFKLFCAVLFLNLCDQSPTDMKSFTFIVLMLFNLIGYSQEFGSFIDDRDGNDYKTVKIGDQTWMAENLKFIPSDSFLLHESKFIDNAINFVKEIKNGSNYVIREDPVYETKITFDINGYTGAESLSMYEVRGDTYGISFRIIYEHSPGKYKISEPIFAKLDNHPWGYYSFPLSTEVCPSGWHLPNNEEWETLTDFLGGKKKAGEKMKLVEGWSGLSVHKKATNESGLSIPSGAYYWDVHGSNASYLNAFYWTYSVQSGRRIPTLKIFNKGSKGIITRGSGIITQPIIPYTVRCIKDE